MMTIIKELKNSLHSLFKMKDLGSLTYFLGLEIHRSSAGLYGSSNKYAQNIIKLACLTDQKQIDTPLD